jgi:hypothetical protein
MSGSAQVRCWCSYIRFFMLCAADGVAAAAAASAAVLIQRPEGMRHHVADLDVNQLQLAVNCRSQSTATEVASYVPSRLQPATAQKLLLTAVARRHVGLWELLLASPHVQQHINAATCEAAIELAVIHEGRDRHESQVVQFVQLIARRPAAAQLDADAVARLLLAAMKLSRFGACPSAPKQLTANAAASKHADLLLAALPQVLQQRAAAYRSKQHRPDGAYDSPSQQLRACLQRLCQLPGAMRISSSTVFRLQLEALQLQGSGSGASMLALCELPAAVSVSSHHLAHLLQTTVKQQQFDAHRALCRLPAFKQLADAEIVQQLLAAAQAGGLHNRETLRWWTDARELGSAAVAPTLAQCLKQR